jgi:hypothetical protein
MQTVTGTGIGVDENLAQICVEGLFLEITKPKHETLWAALFGRGHAGT